MKREKFLPANPSIHSTSLHNISHQIKYLSDTLANEFSFPSKWFQSNYSFDNFPFILEFKRNQNIRLLCFDQNIWFQNKRKIVITIKFTEIQREHESIHFCVFFLMAKHLENAEASSENISKYLHTNKSTFVTSSN